MSGDCKVKFVAPSAFTKWSGSTFKLQAATSAVPPASNVDGVLSGNSLLFVIERPVGGNDSEPALEMWRGSCVCAQTRATLDVGEWRRLQQSGRVETYQVPIKCVDALRQVPPGERLTLHVTTESGSTLASASCQWMGAHLDAVAKSDREAILERFEGGELSVNVFLDSIGEWQRLDSELCARLLMAVLKRALTSSADERQLICEQLSSWLMLREDMRDALAHCNAVELSALQLDVAVLSSASPTAAAAALDTVCAALLAERRFAWCDVYVGVGAPSRHVVAQRCAGLVTAALARLGAFAAEWHASDAARDSALLELRQAEKVFSEIAQPPVSETTNVDNNGGGGGGGGVGNGNDVQVVSLSAPIPTPVSTVATTTSSNDATTRLRSYAQAIGMYVLDVDMAKVDCTCAGLEALLVADCTQRRNVAVAVASAQLTTLVAESVAKETALSTIRQQLRLAQRKVDDAIARLPINATEVEAAKKVRDKHTKALATAERGAAECAERVEQLRLRLCAEDVRLLAVRCAVDTLKELRATRGQLAAAKHVQQHVRVLTRELHALVACRCALSVVGTRGCGKSTLMKTLVNASVLPSSELPCTAVSAVIVHTPGVIEPRLLLPNYAHLNALLRTLSGLVHRKINDMIYQSYQQGTVAVRSGGDGGGGWSRIFGHNGKSSSTNDSAVGVRPVNFAEACEQLAAKMKAKECADLVRELTAFGNIEQFAPQYVGNAIRRALDRVNTLVRVTCLSRTLQCDDDILPLELPFKSDTPLDQLPRIEAELPCLRGVSLMCDVALVDTPGPNEEALDNRLPNQGVNVARKCDQIIEAVSLDMLGQTPVHALHTLLKQASAASGATLCVVGTKRDLRLALANDEVIAGEIVNDLQLTKETPVYVVKARHAECAITGREWARTQRESPDVVPAAPTDEEFAEYAWMQYLFEKRYGDEARVKLGELQSLEQFEALCDEMYEKSGVATPVRELVLRTALTAVPRRAKALLETAVARAAHMLRVLLDEEATLRVSASDADRLRQKTSDLEADIERLQPELARIKQRALDDVSSLLNKRAALLRVSKALPNEQLPALSVRATAPEKLVYDSEASALAALDERGVAVDAAVKELVENNYTQQLAAAISARALAAADEITDRVQGQLANFPELNVRDLVFGAMPAAPNGEQRKAALECAVALRPTTRIEVIYQSWWFFWTKKVERVMRGPTEFVLDGADALEKIYQFGCSSMRRLISDVDAKALAHVREVTDAYVKEAVKALEAKQASYERQTKASDAQVEARKRDVAEHIKRFVSLREHLIELLNIAVPPADTTCLKLVGGARESLLGVPTTTTTTTATPPPPAPRSAPASSATTSEANV